MPSCCGLHSRYNYTLTCCYGFGCVKWLAQYIITIVWRLQILMEAGFKSLPRLEKYYIDVVLKNASKLQSWEECGSQATTPCDNFGLRLYEKMCTLTSEEVLFDRPYTCTFMGFSNQAALLQIKTFFRTGVEYKKTLAYCVRLDRVPGLSVCVQEEIKGYISQHKELGTNSIPRRFSSRTGQVYVDIYA